MKAAKGYENKGFENSLYDKMQEEYERCIQSIHAKNRHLDETAESMRLSILGKENRMKETKRSRFSAVFSSLRFAISTKLAALILSIIL